MGSQDGGSAITCHLRKHDPNYQSESQKARARVRKEQMAFEMAIRGKEGGTSDTKTDNLPTLVQPSAIVSQSDFTSKSGQLSQLAQKKTKLQRIHDPVL